jgi:hypothetical protein
MPKHWGGGGRRSKYGPGMRQCRAGCNSVPLLLKRGNHLGGQSEIRRNNLIFYIVPIYFIFSNPG